MANVNDIKNLYLQGTQASALYLGNTKLWPTGIPVGTVYNFAYTGTVQEITLPPGKYKLQCWGAQGGDVYDYHYYLVAGGGYGGYAEGILHLTEEKTLYAFVGGKPNGVVTDVNASVNTKINGGWNGGGSSYEMSTYGDGYSFAAPGGGATDFSTISSDMSYVNGMNQRVSNSLNSRFLVAGGGGGSSLLCLPDIPDYITSPTLSEGTWSESSGRYLEGYEGIRVCTDPIALSSAGGHYSVQVDSGYEAFLIFLYQYYDPSSLDNMVQRYESWNSYHEWDAEYYDNYLVICIRRTDSGTIYPNDDIGLTFTRYGSEYGEETCFGGAGGGNTSYYGTATQIGGHHSGVGEPSVNNYNYAAGGGGGGWYGGASTESDGHTNIYSDGGSGYVCTTSANGRLLLQSGTTIVGSELFPIPSGTGYEHGHLGHGYARITVLQSEDSGGGSSSSATISWSTISGVWNSTSHSASSEGIAFTCESPGANNSAILRCTFSGITSITFTCVSNGESNYDYLTVGDLNSACTRESYSSTFQGDAGNVRDIAFDFHGNSSERYIEFCYSKDASLDTQPDNATVYIKSYS